MGILRGWAARFIILLDGDKEGKDAADTYARELDLEGEIVLLSDLDEHAKEIENLISPEDRERIKQHLKLRDLPTKKNISRIFQEANASATRLPLTKQTINRIKKLLQDLGVKLEALPKA